MNRLQIAQYIALGATALSVIGFFVGSNGSDVGAIILLLGFIAGIVSYIYGGFKTAINMAVSIAKWGWFVIPFPYDILTFFWCLIFAVIAFIFLPIIPVRKAYKESIK